MLSGYGLGGGTAKIIGHRRAQAQARSKAMLALASAATVGITAMMQTSASATTYVWNNTGTSWNNAADWNVGTGYPGSTGTTDIAMFNGPAGAFLPNLGASVSLAQFDFALTNSSGYTLSSNSSSIAFTLTSVAGGTSSAIYANNNSGTNTISAPIILGGAASSTANFIQAAGGTLGFSGAITSTNAENLNLSGGSLSGIGTFSFAGTASTNGGVLSVGTAAATNTVLNISSNVTALDLWVGGNTNGSGAIYQTAGTVSLTDATTSTGASSPDRDFSLGGAGSTGTAGYGYYSLSGTGALTSNQIDIGARATGVIAVADISGGTLTSNGGINIARGNAAAATYGLLNVTGGTVKYGASAFNGNSLLQMGFQASGQSDLNIGGGTTAAAVTDGTPSSTTGGVDLDNTTSGLDVVNLLTNGTLTTPRVYVTSTNASTLLNFNGGTLKATTTDFSTFVTGLGAVTVYSGGGTIDNSGTNITITNALLAPTGSGVTSVPVSSGGSYTGAPFVVISGTGTGATAYAQMSGGAITNIVITNPGTGYTGTPTISLQGGGAISAATFGTVTTAANSNSGGMTFLGSGVTTLSAANTYTGASTVSAGTLLLTSAGSLAGSLVVAPGATFVGAGSVTGATSIGAGGILVPGASAYNGSSGIPTVTLSTTGIFNTGPLTLQRTSVVDFAFNSSSNSEINVNGALTLMGGVLDFTNSGAATAFSPATFPSTYTLINYTSGQFTGSINNFTVANSQPGKAYSFANTGSSITLTIANSSSGSWTNNTSDELWTDSGNWLNGTIPNAATATALFGSSLANSDGTVNLANTNETIGSLSLDNTSTPGNVSFTIKSTGSGILILDNGQTASPVVGVVAGTHTISAPLQLNAPSTGATTISTTAGSSLTLTGAISSGANGAQSLTFTGLGTVILAEPSSTIANTNINGGFLQVGNGGTAGTLGNGSVAIASGAALSFDLSTPTTVITNNISGAGGSVNQFGSGIVTLTPATANTFGTTAGGFNISSGTIQAGNATALPTGVLLTMSGGTLDLNSFNASVALQNSSAGTITDNSSTAGTTTLNNTWAGAIQTYSGNILNGANGRVLAFNQSGAGTTALAGNNTYSGGTQVSGGTLEGLTNSAFGTGVITLSGAANSLKIANGVTLTNHIVVNAANGGTGLGAISSTTLSDNVTFSGEIDVNVLPTSGGIFGQPTSYGTAYTGLMNFTGPIIAGGTATSIVVRSGTVQFGDTTGNSSYPLLIIDTTGFSLGHNNGMATNAVLQLSNTGSPGNGTIDLNGYNQTLAGITQVGGVGIIQDTNGSSQNTGPGTGPNNSSVLTVNTSATAYPDSAPDVYAGNINSYVQLIKTGAGTLSLTNTSLTANNSYFGGTIIEQGVLAVAVLDGSGASNLGQSFIGASDLTFASPGGTLRYTGATSSTSRSFQINDGVTATMDVSTAGAVLTDSGNASVDGTESSNPASFNKGAGVGTLVLTGSLPYHGNTGVAGGTLLVNGSTGTPGSGTINILAGGTLGGTGTVSGSLNHTAGTIVGGASATVPTSGTLTFTDPLTLNGGTDLNNIAASSLSNSGVNQQGYITAAGGLAFGSTPETVNLQVTGTLPTGTYVYNLFDYSGSLTGTPNLSYISNLGRATFTTNLSTAGEVNVTISSSGAASLYWNSTSSNTWDVHSNSNASSGTSNWYNSGNNLATDKFYQGDSVTFADSGTAVGTGTLGSPLQSTINISSGVTVQPGSINVTANLLNYTINGPGSIGGTGALTLSGASTLTLASSNSYTGGTNINGGLLALANGSSLGTIGTISFGGGTLQYSSSNTVDYSSRFSTANNQPIIIDTNNQSVTFASKLTSSGGSLTKLGLGTLTLSGSNSYSGPTTISGGTLYITAQANLGGGGAIVFNGGALGSAGTTLTNNLVVNSAGGSLTNTGNSFFSGTLVGSGTLTSTGSAADVFTGSGFTAGNPSPSVSFTGTLISQYQVNITDISASPYANYNASTASGNSFVYGVTTSPAGPIQLGSLTGIAGSTVRNGNSTGIGPVIWQIGSLGTSTVFAGNLNDNAASVAANTSALNKVGAGSLTMSGTNGYSGGTTVTAGTLIMASGGAYPTNSALTVASGATFNISNHSPNATYVPQMSSLTNNGTIDVTNNAFLVVGGSISTITAETQIGYHNGAWNGTSASSGVILSSLAAGDTTHLTAVGVATGLTSFEGLTVPSTDVLVKYTYYGDANLSGTVDGSDYSIIDNSYLTEKTSGNISGWYNGDFNYDGVVNGSDYTLIDNAFNSQSANIAAEVALPSAEITGGSGASAVPEPTSIALLGLGAVGLLGRRRRAISPTGRPN